MTTVSILLISYRMERTILEAIESALSQTVPCEIIVSDDASEDGGYALAVDRLSNYSGAHRVVVRRNESNQGLCRHIDTLARIATGDLLVFMAGDDVSYPNRVQKLVQFFDTNPDAFAVGSAVDEIDGTGAILRRGTWFVGSSLTQRDLLTRGKFMTLLGASMAVRRELLSTLPPLRGLVEDTMLTLRASLLGGVHCIPEPLLAWRRHENNLGRWVYARAGTRATARRLRYERTIRMYREIADDHARCLAALAHLPQERRVLGERIVSMYRLEARSREAVLTLPKRQWIEPIARGLLHPGLRRKSFERLGKFLVPRRWLP